MSDAPGAGIGLSWTASQYETRNTVVTPSGGGYIRLIAADNRRWAIRFTSCGNVVGNATIVPGPPPDTVIGGGTTALELLFKWRDNPNWVTGEWFGVDLAGVSILISECLYVGR